MNLLRGNDITVDWLITRDSDNIPIDFSTISQLKIYVITPHKKYECNDYTIAGNTIKIKIKGRDQCLGEYGFEILWVAKDTDARTIINNVFTIIENTGGLSEETISDNFITITIKSTYSAGIKGDKGDPLKWIDLTEANITELQKPSRDMILQLEQTNESVSTSETERIAAETNRTTNENQRTTAETSRNQTEKERNDAENLRKSAETIRVEKEQLRITSEENRISAEKTRTTEEAKRILSEQTRKENESNRTNNETQRIISENQRIITEDDRVTAEQSRVTSEEIRISSETLRITAEEQRIISEESRSHAEIDRQAKEEIRTTAELQRIENAAVITQAVTAATTNAEDTAQHPTYIGEDYYVYQWNKTTQSYDKTTIYCKGVKGEGLDYNTLTPEEKENIKGMSAYDIAIEGGFVGTESEWLLSLKGMNGGEGEKGLSAYQIAVKNGFMGTEEEWETSLIGANGLNAYEVAIKDGFVGTKQEWLASLIGADGASAYELAVRNGYQGTVEEWLLSLKGDTGTFDTTTEFTELTTTDKTVIGAINEVNNKPIPDIFKVNEIRTFPIDHVFNDPNYLLCDGSEVQCTDYPLLDLSEIGTLSEDFIAIDTTGDFKPNPSSSIKGFVKKDNLCIAYTNGEIGYSTDGINWTKAVIPIKCTIVKIDYGNGIFLAAVDFYSVDNILISKDGINWGVSGLKHNRSSNTPWVNMVFGNGNFIFYALPGGTYTYRTKDGLEWYRDMANIAMSSTMLMVMNITFGNGIFISVDLDKNIYKSYDGVNWTISYTLPTTVEFFRNVQYRNGFFFIHYKTISTSYYELRYTEDGTKLYDGPLSSKDVTNRIISSNTMSIYILENVNQMMVRYAYNTRNWKTLTNNSLVATHSPYYSTGVFIDNRFIYYLNQKAYILNYIPHKKILPNLLTDTSKSYIKSLE